MRNMKEYKQLDEAVQNLEAEGAKYTPASTPKHLMNLSLQRL